MTAPPHSATHKLTQAHAQRPPTPPSSTSDSGSPSPRNDRRNRDARDSHAAKSRSSEGMGDLDPLEGYAQEDHGREGPARGDGLRRRRSRAGGATGEGSYSEEGTGSGQSRRARRNRQSMRGGGKGVALEPPRDPDLFLSDDDFHEHLEAEKTSGWHHLPLILVALPPLGAIVHGRAENWSDAIVLTLVVFYLYQLIKVPWDLYYASYTRTVLPSSLSLTLPPEDPSVTARRASSSRSLRRAELFSLLLTFLVPAIGASILHYARGLLSDPDRYINRFLTGLFVVGSSVKPVGHAVKLLKRHSLYHQTLVHYPSAEIALLSSRIEHLESRLTTLQSSTSSQPSQPSSSPEEVSTLSRALRRTQLSLQNTKLESEEKTREVVEAVGEVVRVVEKQEEELELLRGLVDRLSSTQPASASGGYARRGLVSGVLRALLMHFAYPPPSSQHGRDHSLVTRLALLPVSLPATIASWTLQTGARGAVGMLGWREDEYEGGGMKGGSARRLGGAGGKSRGRGLPAPAAYDEDEDETEDEREEAARYARKDRGWVDVAPRQAAVRPSAMSARKVRPAVVAGSGGRRNR
ncbi:hypothetical protein JCM10296v2_002180 [Rhodotorula toruloides]